jgi:hypothetical protein
MKFKMSFSLSSLIVLISLACSMSALADGSNLDPVSPGCYGAMSDVDNSVPDEGIIVSMKDPASGQEYQYRYALMHSGNSWMSICPVTLPAVVPDELVITLVMPSQGKTAVLDSVWLDPELGNGQALRLQINEMPNTTPEVYRTVLLVHNFASAFKSSETGNAILVGRIFDSAVNPENYLGKLLIPFQSAGNSK